MSSLNLNENIHLKNIKITDKFWKRFQELIHTTVLPYQYDVINDNIRDIEPSHALRNFRIAAGLEKGEFYGFVFQDTDVAKWLETLSYSLINYPDPNLEKSADEVIDLISLAQQGDGYLNTYFIIKEPGKQWTNLREAHELYTAGHFIEAAVAYFNSTGKRKLLDIVCKFADLIDNTFGPEEGKIKGYCGHPEIELALVKLFEVTGKESYLNLSKFFIEERGKEPYYFEIEAEKILDFNIFREFKNFDRSYLQAHLPIRRQTTAEGHAVRVVYLFSAVADIALLTKDKELLMVCKKIWNNITTKKMYVTGGIGSAANGEMFTCDYDLPNDTMYTETCASVGMVMFAYRMLKLESDRCYSNVMELEIYNGALSGISIDGKKYFYVNPLDVWPESCKKNPTYKHVKPIRQKWYACACCPTNITRLIASLGQYIYTINENNVYVHLYIGSESNFEINGNPIVIKQETGYPWDEKINIKVQTKSKEEFTLFLRIPGWCDDYECKINNVKVSDKGLHKGYLKIKLKSSDEYNIDFTLKMPVRIIQSNPRVRRNSGKAAIQRGPIIYCLEEIDNGSNLQDISLSQDAKFTFEFDKNLFGGIITISGLAYRSDYDQWDNDKLYDTFKDSKKPVKIRAIPYSLWCNRTPGEMIVWINKK